MNCLESEFPTRSNLYSLYSGEMSADVCDAHVRLIDTETLVQTGLEVDAEVEAPLRHGRDEHAGDHDDGEREGNISVSGKSHDLLHQEALQLMLSF